MSALVAYASSDEEEDIEHPQPVTTPEQAATHREAESGSSRPGNAESSASVASARREPEPRAVTAVPENAVPLGPSLPPPEDSIPIPDRDPTQAPSSPYSANRAMIQDLTLPSVPDFDIPPSPPGSPSPATSKKFEQFLELKKKGTHFNSKLEQSVALRNPSLMDKLLGFVEVEGVSQYETTLPTDLWDPKSFPPWAFRDGLRKSLEKLAKERESEKANGNRSSVDFVLSTTPGATAASGIGGVGRTEKRKGGWK